MAGVRRLEHVAIGVIDLDEAVRFYTDVVGLIELERADEQVFLGCGLDGNFDLAIAEGGTGLDHFAIRADEATFDTYVDRLAAEGVDVERTDGGEPGQERGARFALPASGLTAEIVTVADRRYHNPAAVDGLETAADVHPERSPLAPLDLSHVTVLTPDVREDVEFLRDVVGLSVSDVGLTDEGGTWRIAFTRAGEYHHDVAFIADPEDTLHHVAWEVRDVGHLTRFADRLAAAGHALEVGPVRHGPGSNVAAYFEEPGGNRFEVTTEVETVDPDAEMRTHTPATVPFSVWGGTTPPESFRDGS